MRKSLRFFHLFIVHFSLSYSYYCNIQHDIEGTFTVKKVGDNYVYTFEGQGPYNLDCTALDGVLNLDWLSPLYTLPTEINTFDLQQTGNTWMQYEVRVKAQ